MYIYSGLFYTNLLNVFKSDQVFDTNKVVKIEISDRDMLNTDLDVEELLNHWATRQERELSSDEGGMFFYNHNMLHSTLQSQWRDMFFYFTITIIHNEGGMLF